MSWIYELLDKEMTLERSSHLAVNVLLGLVFGFTFTIGYFNYAWFAIPTMSSIMQHFATKILEPFIFL